MTEALHDVDFTRLAAIVGSPSYAKGAAYARQGHVIELGWDSHEEALFGTVSGSGGRQYETSAYFATSTGSMQFLFGDCSCPVGDNCKHAVALVLTASRVDPPQAPRHESGLASWEQTLAALLDAADPAGAGGTTPLAIEVSLEATGVPARLVRPGRNGRWVAGDLSWARLDTIKYYGNHPAAQLRLLQELYAVYQSRSAASIPSYYAYSHDKTINLAAFDSHQLWPLLDEAAEVGVQLVHRSTALGPLPPYRDAEVRFDLVRDGEVLHVSALVLLDDQKPVVPRRFIGADGHGMVYLDDGVDDGPLRLARLARPVPKQLQQLVLSQSRMEIPPAAQRRFAEEFYPRLRRLATVTSSDGSFTPPEISDPALALKVRYGRDHQLELGWSWAYRIGESRYQVPLADIDGVGYRDLEAEQRVLTGLAELPLEEFGLREKNLVPIARLNGLDTLRFTTELLPLLSDQPGVTVEVTGEPADYREAGDSLTIGVSTDAVPGETDWFDLGLSITVEGRKVPFAQVFTALCNDESHLLLPDGAYFSLHKPELVTLRRLIEEARALRDDDAESDNIKISRYQVGLWDELASLGVVDFQAAAWQRQVRPLLSLESVPMTEPPATVRAELRPYQAEGFSWLTFLWEHRMGGILADDMGLGKTLQALAMICHAKHREPDAAPFVIIAPASVVPNWAAEAQRFTPDLTVVPIYQTLARRGGESLSEATAGADVVVTSYNLFRLDFEAYDKLPWSGLVLDEAQAVKNHQGKTYQRVRQLAAPLKLAITGTPMENNLMELWSLLSITAPGLFPSPDRFRDYYGRPIEKQGETDLLAQLRRRVKPLLKRRTKEQVASDLPAKQEQVLQVQLHPKHHTLYQRRLQRERQKVLGLLEDMDRNRFTILKSLTMLRQLSLHAGLVDDEHPDLPSAKIDALLEHLGDVTGGGHRALVFSQFTRFLGKVRARLDAAGIPYCYLDGKTRDRAGVINGFKDGAAPVFLISLKAGGAGLNLTEADYCFLLDPWWNPATENQAIDRTHRIGQTRNVMVYRLISADTIEEKVMVLKQRKAELFDSVLDDGNHFGTGLTADDIRGLFS